MGFRNRLAVALVAALLPAGAAAQPQVPGPDELERPGRAPHRGVKLSVLGGVEGFTGGLAAQTDPGPGWGLLLTAQPLNEVGIELTYSGGVLALSGTGGSLVRHGASVGLKFTLSAAQVEPYLFAGLGAAHVGVESAPAGSGFAADFFGYAPLGGGLSLHFGRFTVGARGGVDLLFGDQFGPDGLEPSNLWNGRLELGAKF